MNKQEIQNLINELQGTLAELHAHCAGSPYPISVRRFIKTVETEIHAAQQALRQLDDYDLTSMHA